MRTQVYIDKQKISSFFLGAEWVANYYQNRPGLDVLQERIDEFIIDYEAKKEQVHQFPDYLDLY